MEKFMNYKELFLAGEIEFEAIDDYSFEWGNSDDPRLLGEYLGLNAEEEDVWISESEEALRDMLEAQKKQNDNQQKNMHENAYFFVNKDSLLE